MAAAERAACGVLPSARGRLHWRAVVAARAACASGPCVSPRRVLHLMSAAGLYQSRGGERAGRASGASCRLLVRVCRPMPQSPCDRQHPKKTIASTMCTETDSSNKRAAADGKLRPAELNGLPHRPSCHTQLTRDSLQLTKCGETAAQSRSTCGAALPKHPRFARCAFAKTVWPSGLGLPCCDV